MRYDAVIIDPNIYLPKLIQYIHYVPVLKGLAESPDDFLHTSHQAYLEARNIPWLHSSTTRRLLGNRNEHKLGYQKLMPESPTPQMVQLLERGAPKTPGILGGPELAEVAGHRVKRSSRMTPDQVINDVCCLLDVSRDDVMSRSRLRRLALARAVIAWHTTVRGIATLAEISRYLGRVSSTLSKTITSYRKRQPELFKLDALTHLVPLVPSNHSAIANDHSRTIPATTKR